MTVRHPLSALDAAADAPRRLKREAWRETRVRIEVAKEKHSPAGGREVRHWDLFKFLIGGFGLALKACGLYKRGMCNARDLGITRIDLTFDDLPAGFDGFRILQLTDLHVDTDPEITAVATRLLRDIKADLCVMTGDFRKRVRGPIDQILPMMSTLVDRVSAPHGIYAVLGNHDCADMVAPFEAMGINVLVNETASIVQGGDEIQVTGTDDVHYYYTAAANDALAATPDGFKIALVHSAEIADLAADHGFRLYLTGHTHGGQVCLPGGAPIITHMTRHRAYAAGLWRHGDMTGFTSTGVGCSGLPVRFNNRGEIALITLRRK